MKRIADSLRTMSLREETQPSEMDPSSSQETVDGCSSDGWQNPSTSFQYPTEMVEVEITGQSASAIEELFGDETGGAPSKWINPHEPVKIYLPIEACHLIYQQLQERKQQLSVQETSNHSLEIDAGSSPSPSHHHHGSITSSSSTPSPQAIIVDEEKDRQLGFLLCFQEAFPNLAKEEIERYSHCHQYDYPKVFEYLKKLSGFKKQMATCAASTTPAVNSIQPPTTAAPLSAEPSCRIIPSQSPIPIPFTAAKPKESFRPVAANQVSTMADVEALREEARRYHELKKACQQKANSVGASQWAQAQHYMRESNDYGRLAKDKLHEADLALFEINSHRPEIDLHTLSVQRALRMLRLKIDYLREKHPSHKKLNVITGYGRGRKKASVVKSAVMNFLDRQRIGNYVDSVNFGLIVVELITVKEKLSTQADLDNLPLGDE